jgi:acetyl-CoA carboxylase beta subunit
VDYEALLRGVRNPSRIRSEDLIEKLVDGWSSIDSPDPALSVGRGRIAGTEVFVLAQEKPKGRSAKVAAAVNYGMMNAAGYWFVIKQLEKAAAHGLPVVSFIDTPGADPSKEGMERLLGWAISASITAYLATPVPTVSVIIGEGGSGGALAMQVADWRMIVSDGFYSVISPESCSGILFRDGREVARSLQILRPSAPDALRTGMVDEVVDWPDGMAFQQPDRAAALLKERLVAALGRVTAMPPALRRARRFETQLSIGHCKNPEPLVPHPVSRRPTSAPMLKKMVPTGQQTADGQKELSCPRDSGGCGATFGVAACEKAGWACPACGRGERLDAQQWIDLLFDPRSFRELQFELTFSDLEDHGYESELYRATRHKAMSESAVFESIRTGLAEMGGHRCALAVSDFRYMAGTFGAVAGEKLRALCELALKERLPLVALTCSGGARVHEGTLALAQMAKANAALYQLRSQGLPYISVLADPCTGGALGSYATSATVVLAEPHALVAFAGPRVMKLHGFRVDEAALTSQRVAEHGGIDEVVLRGRLRARIGRYLELSRLPHPVAGAVSAPATGEVAQRDVGFRLGRLIAEAASLFDEDPAAADAEPGPNQAPRSLSMTVNQLTDFALVTVPSLLEQATGSRDDRVRANAVEALARFPRPQVSYLHHALRDPHHRVRTSAALGLLGISLETSEAIEVVKQLLSSSDPAERRAGLFAATRFPIETFRAPVEAAAKAAEPEVRAAAGVALFSFRDVSRGRAVLHDLASQTEVQVTAVARRWLAFMPDPAKEALRLMLRELSSGAG